ncbi:cholesterol esterase, partial [Phlyctochytrium bullatum]
MDFSFNRLFNWRCDRLGSWDRKKAVYYHCFAGTSVKNMVHWFQVIDSGTSLIHFNDHTIPWFANLGKAFVPTVHPVHTSVKYPTKHITTRLHLFCGTGDTCISDTHHLRHHLPHDLTTIHEIDGYGHLDFCWATDAKEKVWDPMIALMEEQHRQMDAEVLPTPLPAAAPAAIPDPDAILPARRSQAGGLVRAAGEETGEPDAGAHRVTFAPGTKETDGDATTDNEDAGSDPEESDDAEIPSVEAAIPPTRANPKRQDSGYDDAGR